MYENYWGFSESPFRDPLCEKCFLELPSHEEAVARILYLIEERRHCGILTGPAGTGKSSLLQLVHRELQRTQLRTALVDLYGLGGDEFVWSLAAALRLAPGESETPSRTWRLLCDYLEGIQLSRLQCVLLFDHLEHARPDCIHLLERLLHPRYAPERWLTMILATRNMGDAGRFSELADLGAELAPLDRWQTAAYVHDSLAGVDCHREIFEPGALDALYDQTHGVVRDINRLCELSLLAAMGERSENVDSAVVERASAELQGGRASAARLFVTRDLVPNSAR